MILSLAECTHQVVNKIGHKANWLGFVISTVGYNYVPKGICLTTDEFQRFCSDNKNLKRIIENKISDIQQNPIRMRKDLHEIRTAIRDSIIDESIVQEIITKCQEENISLEHGVAVRSSSSYEDSSSSAYAGVFSSSLALHNISEIICAIKRTWASLFSEFVLINQGMKDEIGGMSVIIQQMDACNYHGVLFSRDPVFENDQMFVEMSSTVSGIVEGDSPTMAMHIAYHEPITTDILCDELSQLRKCLITLRERSNQELDIEFGIEEGKISVLQCRPITSLVQTDTYMLINQDDVKVCSQTDLRQCAPLFRRYLGKQYLFRLEVSQAGFEVYRQYYLVYRKSHFSYKIIEEVDKVIRTEPIILAFNINERSVKCMKSDLYQVLVDHNKVVYDDYICVRIGEIIAAELSGYSAVTADGDVLIEYAPGRMSQVRSGDSAPTTVLISQGKVTYINDPIHHTIDKVDQTGQRSLKCYEKRAPCLTDDQCNDIEKFTRTLSVKFKNSTLEWYYANGALYGKDISLEENSVAYSRSTTKCLSIGVVRGHCLHLDCSNLFDFLAKKYDLSLVPHSDLEEMVFSDFRYKEICKKLAENPGPIIAIAPKPSLGHMIIADKVAGFVFEKGSILSHVGITLREKGIPAVIDEIAGQYEDGTMIEISPDGIQICKE